MTRKKRQIALVTTPPGLLTEVFFDLNPEIEEFIDLGDPKAFYAQYTFGNKNNNNYCFPKRACVPWPCLPLY